MKKVLLINPHWKRPGIRDRVRRDSGVAHPGLLQIAEILLRHDKSVALLDLGLDEVMIPDKINNALELEDPDIVGITATTCSYPGALEIAREIKTIDPDILIVGGGIHFALNYMDILSGEEGKYFDLICTGEGELPMLEIVRHMEGEKKIDSIKGIAFKNKTCDLTANPPVRPMSIPPVIDEAWSLLDPRLYTFKDKRKFGVEINTMRGCWGKCTFCPEPYRLPAVTWMNHEHIIRQLKIVKERLDPSYVFIGDSNFGCPIPRLKEFVKSMREEGLFMPFNFLARLDDVYRYRELLPELREIGCFLIHYGGERTTDAGQSYLRKGESSSITAEVTRMIQDADIAAKATFIFGLPTDDRDSMKRMIDDIYQINPDIVSFGCYTPIPGTPSFENDHRFVNIEDLSYYTVNYTVCDTLKMSQNEVEEFLDAEWLSFWKSSTHRGRLKQLSNPSSLRIVNAYYDFIDEE
jgi:anaerobic magnesium-protoporphyrin IX monomethyl ester cyclase